MAAVRIGKRGNIDMTTGSIVRALILFSLPVMLGSLFQKLYSTVDAWVVGNYVSDEAFSAVGTVSPIINMLLNLFIGFTTGTTAVVARHVGARDEEGAHKAVHTACLLAVVLSAILTVVGVCMTPAMLRLIHTPADVYPESYRYLSIYFAGVGGMLLYNMGSAILRAAGDTRHPSLFLVISSLINVVLDLVLVLVFDMGVAGVAWATVISQAVSAVLVIAALMRTDPIVRLHPRRMRFYGETLKRITAVSLPASLQLSITSFSNVFVQSYINDFGKACMGGWTAFQKVNNFVDIPFCAVAVAVSTFVGQNLGAKQLERARQGVRTAQLLGGGSALLASAVAVIFAPQIAAFFTDSEEIIRYATLFIRLITASEVILSVNQIYTSALRGSGNTRVPMVIMLGSYVACRQLYLLTVTALVPGNVVLVAASYPVTWLVATVWLWAYYRFVGLERHTQKAE